MSFRCANCGETGTKEQLEQHDCGNPYIEKDIRMCPWCGVQGTPEQIRRHECDPQPMAESTGGYPPEVDDSE